MTDARSDLEWLADASNPLLTEDNLARIADRLRPDRLMWNTFRTLALWNTEAWMPSLMEIACGDQNRLTPLEWTGGTVTPWEPHGLDWQAMSPTAIDGPAAYVVAACTLGADPSVEQLRAAAVAALDASVEGGRAAGIVVVAPPGADGLDDQIRRAADVVLHDGTLAADRLEGAVGWVSWPELGRLALDLVEENDPQVAEQVRQLVTELQNRFPDATV